MIWLLSALSIYSLVGCASVDTQQVVGLTQAGYESKDLAQSLKQIATKGFVCKEKTILQSHTAYVQRYSADGTTKALKVYRCSKQTNYLLWRTSTYTYLVGQYGKVVAIGRMGAYKTRTMVWRQRPSNAECVSKCVKPNTKAP